MSNRLLLLIAFPVAIIVSFIVGYNTGKPKNKKEHFYKKRLIAGHNISLDSANAVDSINPAATFSSNYQPITGTVLEWDKKRRFLIGFLSDHKKTGKLYVGGIDTTLTDYPNLYETRAWISKKFNVKNIHIVAISEYKESDQIKFWNIK